MKKYVSFLFLITSFIIFSQSSKNVEKGLFKVNALLPGASYELGAGNNTTFNFDLLLVPDFGGNPLEIFPAVGAEFRYFTNMNRRLGKDKNISGNSGNYVGFLNQLLIAAPLLGNLEYDIPFVYNGAIVYGLQRTYNKGFYFNLSFGPGFFTRDNDPTAGILIDIKLGWILSGRK